MPVRTHLVCDAAGCTAETPGDEVGAVSWGLAVDRDAEPVTLCPGCYGPIAKVLLDVLTPTSELVASSQPDLNDDKREEATQEHEEQADADAWGNPPQKGVPVCECRDNQVKGSTHRPWCSMYILPTAAVEG